jgi:hypothetical protein
MRGFSYVVLGIGVPLTLTSIGIDAGVLVLAAAGLTAAGLLLLALSFERVRELLAAGTKPERASLAQAVLSSSLTLGFGIGAALTNPGDSALRIGLLFGAMVSVLWWLHVIARAAARQWIELSRTRSRDDRARNLELEMALAEAQRCLGDAEESVRRLPLSEEENERMRAVIQHAINVLLGLEAAKEGRAGVAELGPRAWIEHRCLRATRDVLEEIAGRPPGYRIELAVLRVSNEVIFVEMAAGEYVKSIQAQGGCPGIGDIAEIVDSKARQGGFADSDAVEFELSGETHHMVAFATGPLDDTDRQLLSLIASMFVVLKLALDSEPV